MSITIIIIAATVAASFYAWNNQDIYQKWMMNPYLVSNKGEYFRFLTSGFIHADQAHLFINMLSFYFFGRNLELFLSYNFGATGMWYYLGFYLLSIVVSEIPTFLKHRNDHRYNSLGASGAVAAVIFAYIIIGPTEYIYLFFILKVPAFIFGFLYLFYSFTAAQKQSDRINHDAHFYGAAFGILFIILIEPELINNFFYQIKNWNILK
jgi:membrane associated rhomboid family serine protease